MFAWSRAPVGMVPPMSVAPYTTFANAQGSPPQRAPPTPQSPCMEKFDILAAAASDLFEDAAKEEFKSGTKRGSDGAPKTLSTSPRTSKSPKTPKKNATAQDTTVSPTPSVPSPTGEAPAKSTGRAPRVSVSSSVKRVLEIPEEKEADFDCDSNSESEDGGSISGSLNLFGHPSDDEDDEVPLAEMTRRHRPSVLSVKVSSPTPDMASPKDPARPPQKRRRSSTTTPTRTESPSAQPKKAPGKPRGRPSARPVEEGQVARFMGWRCTFCKNYPNPSGRDRAGNPRVRRYNFTPKNSNKVYLICAACDAYRRRHGGMEGRMDALRLEEASL